MSKETTKLDWSYRPAAESAALGRKARKQVPRESHAAPPGADRDPVALLQSQSVNRVAELVPIRYGRMLASPFTFYRGAALLMAHDLAESPNSGITVQACGDAHLSNFGVFGTPERELVFDLNDFDETLPGPWEWDVKRLATSVLIAARANELSTKAQQTATLAAVRRYREAMRTFAGQTNLQVWYARIAIDELLNSHLAEDIGGRYKQAAAKSIKKARGRDNSSSFAKLTTVQDGRPRIRPQPPVVVPYDVLYPSIPVAELYADLVAQMDLYRETLEDDRRILLERYTLVDFARRIVGVGSVGTRCWIALLLGRDQQDPLFLQTKQAGPSVLEAYVGPSQYENHGQRVVSGQRLMQAASDMLLGWVTYQGITSSEPYDYYIRQFRDWKGSVDIPGLDARGMAAYGELCGWTLARAHARSGDRIAIAAYLGGGPAFDKAVLSFAEAYAERNERDFKALKKAAKAGQIPVQYGV